MFEQLCALLLRLYPPGFRDAYGRDALQLMQDRAREERGLLRRSRLCVDLLCDLLAISFKGWSSASPAMMTAANDGVRVPSFHLIEATGPKPESLAAGLLTSMLMFAVFSLLFQPKEFTESPARVSEGPGSASDAAATNPSDAPDHIIVLASDTRATLIASVAAHLKEHYFDREDGWQLAVAVLAHQKDGHYESATTWQELVDRLNRDIYDTGRTIGIPAGVFVADVIYTEQPIPIGPPTPAAAQREQRRQVLLKRNCLFERIEIFANNIGYLKVNGFPEPSICREATRRAMAAMNAVDALIIDLRDNRGGMGELALQIAGYLFDRPTFLYDPREASRVPKHTASPIAGNAIADKPLYLLTSSKTQSAAEYFVYNLKMRRRATIVGETTAGAQHSGRFYRLGDHFGIGIQATPPPPNPFRIKGWEVIGVEPDVKVSSADALDTATHLARSKRLTR